MPKKTMKHRKSKRSTRRHRVKKGGADSQAIKIPDSAFKHVTPVNSDNAWYKIA